VEDLVSRTGSGYRHMGRPGNGTGAFILNPAGRTVTVGITGDLLVSGSGVISGFHRDDTLNSACFMEHTQTPGAPGAPGEKLYKTGYIAAWQQDGALVFPGRADNRIMLKGFPMALEEIEALLYRRPLVEACAAISRQSAGEPETAAVYVVLKENIRRIPFRRGIYQIGPIAAACGRDRGQEIPPAHRFP
jgi:non-ribosomal peptide synthetase component E (peptide arylation enzyme)